MNKPVLFCIDDDPEVLSAVERDLRMYYRNNYKIVTASSGGDGLEALSLLKQRNAPIALFLVDQRMPGMTGTQFLEKALAFYPDAKKVLLTAYADTEAAIACINKIGLDHYLMKPWDPPEVKFFPVLNDLLFDWQTEVKQPYEGIRIAGSRWSHGSYAIREFLSGNNIPYQWVDIDQDEPTRELIKPLSDNLKKLPVVLFPDGSTLTDPSHLELAQKLGIQTVAQKPFYDLVVIGAGPAGLANAVYGASEGLRTLIIERSSPGGQAGTSSKIENYLGFPAGVTGADLALRAVAQAKRFGAELLTAQEAVSFRREDPYRIITLSDGSEISCYTLVFATGMSVRKLEVPGVADLEGLGVFYGAALSEAATYRNKDICIVGGANSAGQGAVFFSRYARSVTILIRAAEGLKAAMSQYLIDRIETTPNIRVISSVEVSSVEGNGFLEKVNIKNVQTNEITALEMSAMFIFIGAAPHADMCEGFITLDDKGFIMTGPDLPRTAGKISGWTLDRDPYLFETNVPGVFGVGDVRSGANRRVATAVGEGSAAIYMVHRYLATV